MTYSKSLKWGRMTEWRDALRARAEEFARVNVPPVDLLELLDMADDLDRVLVALLQLHGRDGLDAVYVQVEELRGDPGFRGLLELLGRARRIEGTSDVDP